MSNITSTKVQKQLKKIARTFIENSQNFSLLFGNIIFRERKRYYKGYHNNSEKDIVITITKSRA
jgi:hypothetical protein